MRSPDPNPAMAEGLDMTPSPNVLMATPAGSILTMRPLPRSAA